MLLADHLHLLLLLYCTTGIRSVKTSGTNNGIHTAYIESEGCHWGGSDCTKSVCRIQVDGVKHVDLFNVASEYGFYLLSFGLPRFNFLEKKIYRTYDRTNDVQDMITWINGLSDGTLVFGCSRDEATTSMTNEAWNALASIGLTNAYKTTYASHAIFGYKGNWPGSMKRSLSAAASKVSGHVTYFLPPVNFVVELSSNNMVNVAWQPVSNRLPDLYITYSESYLNSTVHHHTKVVTSASKQAVIGPLQADAWYNISIQAPLRNNETHVIIPAKPYIFIAKNNNLGCPAGIYEFVLKIDGRKSTFNYGSALWTNLDPFSKLNAYTGLFDDFEVKSEAYTQTKLREICMGIKDLSSNQIKFAEIDLPTQDTTMLQLHAKSATLRLPLDVMNKLRPNGITAATHKCRHGFSKHRGTVKFELGFEGSIGTDCQAPMILTGVGTNIDNNKYSSISKDSGSRKNTFAYVLMSYYVDSKWLSWGPWSHCDRECGNGIKIRFRNSTKPLGSGLPLPPFSNSTEGCKLQDCIPPAPQNVTAYNISSKQLRVTWDDIPAAFLTNTKKYYGINMTDVKGIAKNLFEHYSVPGRTIYGLDIYTVYCFEVYIVLQSDTEGNRSKRVCARTDESVPLDPPGSISAINVTSWCLLINWTSIPVDRAQGIVLNYKIYYKETGATSYNSIMTSSNTSKMLCELLPYTHYAIKISGFTRIGEGAVSITPQYFLTDEYIPSKAPTITSTVETSSTSIEVTWTQIPEDFWNGKPLRYIIFYVRRDLYLVPETANNVSSINVTYPATTFELIHLEKYKMYAIWLIACTIKGCGINSTVAFHRTDEDIPTKGPTSIAYNSSSFSILANWSQLEEEYRLGVLLQYRIFCKNLKTGTEVFVDVSASESHVNISGLLPFLNHSIEVSAGNSKGFGPRGRAAYSFTDEFIPSAAPPNFSGKNISSYSLELRWFDIPSDLWHGIPLGFTILYRETLSDDDNWNVTVVYSGSSFRGEIHNLTAYTDYTLKIAGFTIKGNGTFSNEIVVKTDEDAPYEPPRSLNMSSLNASGVVVTWKAPHKEKVRGIIRGYKVTYIAVYTEEDFVSQLLPAKHRSRRAVISQHLDFKQRNITVGADQFQLELKGLRGYTNYSIQILAFTILEGPFCEPLYVLTRESVPAMSPINVTAKASTYTAIEVKWKHVLPAYTHGVIRGFLVYYQFGNHSEATEFTETQVAEKPLLVITHLKIFAWYTIQVAASTEIGLGIKSDPIYARTDEWIPMRAPDNVGAKSFVMPFNIDITWNPLDSKYWNGIPLGYLIVLTTVSIGGVKVDSSASLKYTKRIDARFTKFSFTNAKPYHKYGIEISAYTRIGDGEPSKMQYVETCYVSKAVLTTSWFDYLPFITNNPKSETPDGFLPFILETALKHCSRFCDVPKIQKNAILDFARDGKQRQARKKDYTEFVATISNDTDFSFPVIKPSFSDEEYKFIELLPISEVVQVEGKVLLNTIGQSVSSSLSGLFAIYVLFFLLCWLAGCCIWLVEARKNTEELRRHPLPGMFDGVYWAFVTATTVGYGDITPISLMGKIVAIIWSLIGLIMVGFLSGSLSNALTASEVSISTIKTIPKFGVGMVKNSWEYMIAQKRGLRIDHSYTSYNTLLNAVSNGSVKYGIMDKEVSIALAALLVKNTISVKEVIPFDGSIGMFTAGSARQLANCFESYIREEKGKILEAKKLAIQEIAEKTRKQLLIKGNVSLEVTPKTPEFFSWESLVMQAYVKIFGILLIAILTIGCLVEVVKIFKKRMKKMKTVGPLKGEDIGVLKEKAVSDSYDDIQIFENQMTSMIENLVEKVETATQEMDKNHCLERINLQRAKWKLYGTYKYVDPTKFGVPFE